MNRRSTIVTFLEFRRVRTESKKQNGNVLAKGRRTETNRVFFPDSNLFSPTFRPPLSTVFREPATTHGETVRDFRTDRTYPSRSLEWRLYRLSFDLKQSFLKTDRTEKKEIFWLRTVVTDHDFRFGWFFLYLEHEEEKIIRQHSTSVTRWKFDSFFYSAIGFAWIVTRWIRTSVSGR